MKFIILLAWIVKTPRIQYVCVCVHAHVCVCVREGGESLYKLNLQITSQCVDSLITTAHFLSYFCYHQPTKLQ